MTTHHLKTWPEPFLDMWLGRKRYEIRPNDRNFKPGDMLLLQEWEPRRGNTEASLGEGGYSGRTVLALVTHLTPGGQWGLPDGLCVMGIDLLERRTLP